MLLGDVVVCPAVAADQAPDARRHARRRAGPAGGARRAARARPRPRRAGRDGRRCARASWRCSRRTTGTARRRPASARSTPISDRRREQRRRADARRDHRPAARADRSWRSPRRRSTASRGVKAQAIADDQRRRSRAGRCCASSTHPERFINPLLVTVTVLQTVQAYLTDVCSPTACSAPWASPSASSLNVVVFFVFAEAMPKTWAVLHAERAGAAHRPLHRAGWSSFPPLRIISRGPDRAHQRAAAGQGPQGGPVRQRAGAARHRRGGRRRRGDRARGARADREHHRVRRHRRPRGDGAAARHGDRRARRHGHRRPSTWRSPTAYSRLPVLRRATATTSSAWPTPRT